MIRIKLRNKPVSTPAAPIKTISRPPNPSPPAAPIVSKPVKEKECTLDFRIIIDTKKVINKS